MRWRWGGTYAGYIDVPRWNLTLRPAKHQPLISFETFQKIRGRLHETAKVPARKDLAVDFPLRGFVICGHCSTRLTIYWAKGRKAHYPYYHCPQKGCEAYGRSVPRERIEGEFETILHAMRPTRNLYVLAHDMFRALWHKRIDGAKERRQGLETEIGKIERDVSQLLDRVIGADSEPSFAPMKAASAIWRSAGPN